MGTHPVHSSRPFNNAPLVSMSADGAAPFPEDRQRYENARKELIQALQKKRTVDKQLVSVAFLMVKF